MKLVLIRHGQTDVNSKNRLHKSNDDAQLNQKGIVQSQKTALACKELNVEAIYSSKELRAIQTAELIAEQLNIINSPLAGLEERNWGEWSTKSWPEIKEILDRLELFERYKFVPPAGESWEHMESRLQLVLDYISEQRFKVIAVVTHGGALRGIIPLLKGTNKSESFKYDFENCSITIFNKSKSIYNEIIVNNTSHLE